MTRHVWVGFVVALLASSCLPAPAFAATYSWDGSESGNFGTANNWTPAGPPANGDDVIIDYGAVDIDDGLSPGKDYNSFSVGPNYTGTIGTSTTNCLTFSSDTVVWAGAGDGNYIAAGTNGFDSLIISKVDTGTGDLYVEGTVTTLLLERGTLTLGSTAGSSATVTTFYLEALSNTASNAVVTIAEATVTTLYKRYGTLTIDGTAAAITTYYHDLGSATVTDGTITTLVQRGGTIDWDTTDTLTSLTVFGGTFDGSTDLNAKTITAAEVHSGGTLDVDNDIGNITITNGTTQYAGTIVAPKGATVSY